MQEYSDRINTYKEEIFLYRDIIISNLYRLEDIITLNKTFPAYGKNIYFRRT